VTPSRIESSPAPFEIVLKLRTTLFRLRRNAKKETELIVIFCFYNSCVCVMCVCVCCLCAVCLYVCFQSSETEVSTRGNGKREIETEEESTDGMMVGSTRETGSTERLTGTESKPVRMDRCGTMASGKTIFRNYD